MREILTAIIAAASVAGCQSIDERPAKWSYIHAAIIEPSCATATCHSQLNSIAALNLATSDSAYNMLTGVVCNEPFGEIEEPDGNFIVPGSSDFSQLMYQLRGETPDGVPYRDVMPPDIRLPTPEIELIARWIDEGAPCN